MKMIQIELFLLLSAILFVVGLYGVLTTNRGIVMLMSIEIMLNAGNLNLIAFAAYWGSALGQVFVIFSLAIAAAEVAVGIALLLNVYKVKKTTKINDMTILRW
ncbi:MAG: NADH-quinone oxidoreductase subunit NuoK [Candidatus Methanomethylophilaceae archaeon]|nr:NADH-quinone oxidoreductase subunit NuoK [Candidatus Methanomethylophilaceae archaeon]